MSSRIAIYLAEAGEFASSLELKTVVANWAWRFAAGLRELGGRLDVGKGSEGRGAIVTLRLPIGE
jgi:hypothetical protein